MTMKLFREMKVSFKYDSHVSNDTHSFTRYFTMSPKAFFWYISAYLKTNTVTNMKQAVENYNYKKPRQIEMFGWYLLVILVWFVTLDLLLFDTDYCVKYRNFT